MSEQQAEGLAKICWTDPQSGDYRELVLAEGATITIGRGPDNQIAIPERHVSRQHAVVSYRDGIFMISDLGSANGTFVNGERLVQGVQKPVFENDEIRFGAERFLFHWRRRSTRT